jgi:hypothetical protein
MATWQPPSTLTVGSPLPSSYWNVVANNEVFLYQAPYGLFYNTVSTSCENNASEQVSLGGATASNYSMMVSSNNVVVPITGIYHVDFGIQLASSGVGGQFFSGAGQNSGLVLVGSSPPGTLAAPQSNGSGLISCQAGDALYLAILNNTGGTVYTNPGPTITYLHVNFIGSV